MVIKNQSPFFLSPSRPTPLLLLISTLAILLTFPGDHSLDPPSQIDHSKSHPGVAILSTHTPALTPQEEGRVYRVLLESLPEEIDPRSNGVSLYHYIHLHLYYPLFSQGNDGQLESSFLDLEHTRSFSSKFDDFLICLKKNLTFSDGSPIQIEHLRSALETIHWRKQFLPAIRKITEEPHLPCLRIQLQDSAPTYFHEMTGVSSTLLAGPSVHRVQIGLGPYKILSKNKNLIVLEATDPQIPRYFQRIEYVRFPQLPQTPQKDGVSQENFFSGSQPKSLKMSDWNHLYLHRIPDFSPSDIQIIRRPALKIYYLLVQIRNRKRRILFSKNFPKPIFLAHLHLPLSPTEGIIPQGLPGSIESPQEESIEKSQTGGSQPLSPASSQTSSQTSYRTPSPLSPQSSRKENKDKPQRNVELDPLKFYVYSKDQLPGIKTFFNSMDSHITGEVVETEFLSFEEILKAVTHPPHHHSHREDIITLLGTDVLDSDPEEFFNGFRPENPNLLFHPLKKFERQLREASRHRGTKKFASLLEIAHRELLRSGYIIPLGQYVHNQVYPKEIKNITFADRVNGFPSIQLMEYEETPDQLETLHQ